MNVLEIKGLTKTYDRFKLDHADLVVRKGTIMGLIGENGAGKSTLMKGSLDLIHRDEGLVLFWGTSLWEKPKEIKNRLGVVLDEINFYQTMTALQVSSICRGIYTNWDNEVFQNLLIRLNVDKNKRIKDFSKGMKIKLSLAVAMSHHADLLILDEPTSGLDPVAREDLLQLFREFVADGERAILLSSHITEDLKKVADEITFIHKGRIVFSKDKAQLLEEGDIDQIMLNYVGGIR